MAIVFQPNLFWNYLGFDLFGVSYGDSPLAFVVAVAWGYLPVGYSDCAALFSFFAFFAISVSYCRNGSGYPGLPHCRSSLLL